MGPRRRSNRSLRRRSARWAVPGERMKAGGEYRVPLSSRVVEVLDEVAERFGGDGLVFPPPREGAQPLRDGDPSTRNWRSKLPARPTLQLPRLGLGVHRRAARGVRVGAGRSPLRPIRSGCSRRRIGSGTVGRAHTIRKAPAAGPTDRVSRPTQPIGPRARRRYYLPAGGQRRRSACWGRDTSSRPRCAVWRLAREPGLLPRSSSQVAPPGRFRYVVWRTSRL